MEFSTVLLILRWLLTLAIAVAVVIILSLYIRGAFRGSVKYRVKEGPAAQDQRFPLVLASVSNSFLSEGRITQFWSDHDQIQAERLNAIQQAKQSIHFETFIMTPGRRANDFAAAIAERAAAGLEVLVIVDAYGTLSIPKRYWQRLEAAGVQIVFFNSFNWRAPANVAGRTHRKLLLIDATVGFIGGAGVSDQWDGEQKQPKWLDVEMKIEGEAVSVLEGQFIQHWTYGGGQANLQQDVSRINHSAPLPHIVITAGNNPTYRFSPIKSLKENTVVAARERLWLASPYLLPDQNLRELLIEAKKSGVDVRLLTASADKIDKTYVYYAAFELFGELLANGITIYEYQPSMIHAKMLLVDHYWVNTGSANFDSRSFFHNEELDISTDDPRLIQDIEATFETAFASSQQVSLAEWQHRSWWRHRLFGNLIRFIQWQL